MILKCFEDLMIGMITYTLNVGMIHFNQINKTKSYDRSKCKRSEM